MLTPRTLQSILYLCCLLINYARNVTEWLKKITKESVTKNKKTKIALKIIIQTQKICFT
jgi:hypothetical protein